MWLAALIGLHLEMARTVDWGYGCGGNCAIRNTGRSTVTLTIGAEGAVIVDVGWHKLSEHHPGGGSVQETRWRTEWRGKGRELGARLRFDLRGTAQCTRVETQDEGSEHHELTSGCPRTPPSMQLTCERAEVVAADKPRKVWRCRAARMPPGTVMPWVFGAEEILDETMAGEPRPEASYSVR